MYQAPGSVLVMGAYINIESRMDETLNIAQKAQRLSNLDPTHLVRGT